MYFPHTVLTALCLLPLLALIGCGSSGPELVEVSGTVTLNGQPAPGVVLTFIPEATGGSPSYGKTDARGYYQLMFTATRYGALPGKHRVELHTTRLSPDELSEMRAAGEEVPEQQVEIPRQYLQPGALTAEVVSDDQPVDFALTN